MSSSSLSPNYLPSPEIGSSVNKVCRRPEEMGANYASGSSKYTNRAVTILFFKILKVFSSIVYRPCVDENGHYPRTSMVPD